MRTRRARKQGKRRRRGSARRSVAEQLTFGSAFGIRRPGGGRKKSPGSGVSHLRRDEVKPGHPVHVTMKLARGLPRLRRKGEHRVLVRAFAKARRRAGRLEGGVFRLVHYSVQNDHLHLICEAGDRVSLSRGVQGLATRVAMGLNRLWERRGKVFADRYHDRVLRSPREVRNVLAYVLQNGRQTPAALRTPAGHLQLGRLVRRLEGLGRRRVPGTARARGGSAQLAAPQGLATARLALGRGSASRIARMHPTTPRRARSPAQPLFAWRRRADLR